MTQKQALKIMTSGQNVFLTGSPGAGKTYVLSQFISLAKANGDIVAVTATTGIAATHLSGITIHSWSGIGISSSFNDPAIQKVLSNKQIKARYKNTDILIIDEVSMLNDERLDLINDLAKLFRKSNEPFGGIQLILVGDLFQLPPVSRDQSSSNFVYRSKAWLELGFKICYLTEQHRQSPSDGLNKVLEAIRQGNLTEEHLETINSRRTTVDGPDHLTRLYAHNYDVDQLNNLKLQKLKGKSHDFIMDSTGPANEVRRLKESILSPEKLELKVGSEVMFVVNNASAGYVNGSRGTVVQFSDSLPVVKLLTGRYVEAKKHKWQVEVNGLTLASASQIPLRLAWAITIHKSQGMSLDSAEVDLSHAFTPGMGYVALSRLRSLEGLHLRSINSMAFVVNSEALKIDHRLREASNRLIEL
jgi:ATP-dependent DNA helicase PIF1